MAFLFLFFQALVAPSFHNLPEHLILLIKFNSFAMTILTGNKPQQAAAPHAGVKSVTEPAVPQQMSVPAPQQTSAPAPQQFSLDAAWKTQLQEEEEKGWFSSRKDCVASCERLLWLVFL